MSENIKPTADPLGETKDPYVQFFTMLLAWLGIEDDKPMTRKQKVLAWLVGGVLALFLEEKVTKVVKELGALLGLTEDKVKGISLYLADLAARIAKRGWGAVTLTLATILVYPLIIIIGLTLTPLHFSVTFIVGLFLVLLCLWAIGRAWGLPTGMWPKRLAASGVRLVLVILILGLFPSGIWVRVCGHNTPFWWATDQVNPAQTVATEIAAEYADYEQALKIVRLEAIRTKI
ncbi:MAG: hypothetical protein WC480_00700 [Patescibacteria group bacterium]